ncbi:Fe-S cluster assembly sulfur transfer protein SufU [Rubeoparvulum massiliense]|uniref:Fe-S cluster assembly sulfur transfer protein SufU n=1 Tax=Rubeoparvulum massiliense TaxID=1631346 RepID=UPI00065E938C|nr:SUF system NifU family Fe-S cluster assembly protein [Rubeoparvulum massiliense]
MSLDNLYRQVIMEHYQHPRNRGHLDGDGVLTVHLNNPTCGDKITLQLLVDDGKISEIKFEGDGCSISMASASMMTAAVKGQTVENALKFADLFSQMMLGEEVELDDLDWGDIEALQGVSKFPARIKCATLGWKALEKGVGSESKEE